MNELPHRVDVVSGQPAQNDTPPASLTILLLTNSQILTGAATKYMRESRQPVVCDSKRRGRNLVYYLLRLLVWRS